MGIARNGSGTVWLGTQQHLWRFENYMDGPDEKKDALFVPISSHLTGDVDVHDIQVAPDGSPYFVVTRFNCLATIDDRHSFVPIQLPPFIDRLAAED